MGLITIHNQEITIQVDTFGAELRSLKDNGTGREYLWNADPKYWKHTSPVLFPFVGGCKEKHYQYQGETYFMGQHGFARDMEFQLVSQTENEVWFELRDTAKTRESYPFAFSLRIGYTVEKREVQVHWQVRNTDTKQMYFAIGGHPAFMCPCEEGTAQTDYFIGFDQNEDALGDHEGCDREILSTMITEEGLASYDRMRYELKDGVMPITEHMFDHDALVIENHQAHQVSLMAPDRTPYVTVAFDAPLFGIWSPARKNAPFICIEPWYGRCDREDFIGTLEQREWENELAPGEQFFSVYSIMI